jgi:hypothetical protein
MRLGGLIKSRKGIKFALDSFSKRLPKGKRDKVFIKGQGYTWYFCAMCSPDPLKGAMYFPFVTQINKQLFFPAMVFAGRTAMFCLYIGVCIPAPANGNDNSPDPSGQNLHPSP